MGCFGNRNKGPPTYTQKWDFITLDDFRCTSWRIYLAYGWLWFMACVSVAVYTVDTFTAVNLLVYDKWSSQVQPALAFKYSKWLFAACILLSWALCLYEWLRALRVINRGGIAESYMDPLAVSLQSMRSQGWKRFLVFSELTKSKKGTDYVALFVYFSFQGAIRVILAEGPRQGVNAMTLYAVLRADILNTGNNEHHSAIQQFFLNIKILAETNSEQAAIYFSMLFTLLIWIISAISLITSAVLYLLFLWHYIPAQDGSLSAYCRRKIDKRLAKIVEHKVVAAMEEEERQHRKAEQKAELKRQKTGDILTVPTKIMRQPTLPEFAKGAQSEDLEKQPTLPLARQGTNETVSTLPLYSSAPPSQHSNDRTFREPVLPNGRFPVRPGMPSRTGTQSSAYSSASYASDAPLLSNAGFAGGADQPPPMPAPVFNRQPSQSSFARPMAGRTFSQSTQSSQRPPAPGARMNGRNPSNAFNPGPPRFNTPVSRMNTPASGRPFTPASRDGPLPPPPAGSRAHVPSRSNSDDYFGHNPNVPPMRSNTGFELGRDPQMPLTRTGTESELHQGIQMPPARSNTGFEYNESFDNMSSGGPYGTAAHDGLNSSTTHPTLPGDFVRPFTPPAPSNTPGAYRALPPRESASSAAHQPQSSVSTQSTYTAYNGSQTFQHKPPKASFTRPFTPMTSKDDPTLDHESYEMQPQPSHSTPLPAPAAAGAYVAFNPAMHSASSTPAPPATPQPNVAPVAGLANGPHIVGHLRAESPDNGTAHSAHTSTYGGILDDYGADDDDFRRTPSPALQHHPATGV